MLSAKGLYCAAFALLALGPAAAMSQEAFTRQTANVRAGPDRSYPLVSQLAPSAPVRVMGCLEDWSWCDVGFDDSRGWVYAPFLLYGVADDRVSLYTYGPSLGIPIVGFTLGAYWDEHYRQRSWYGAREDWSRRAPPPHHPPTGMPPHAVYTAGMHADRGGRPAPAAGRPNEAPHEARQEAPQHAGAAPEHAQAAARAPEHASAPRADAGRSPERTGAPTPAREAPQKMEHVPERPNAEGGPKGSEQRGGEKPGGEERR